MWSAETTEVFDEWFTGLGVDQQIEITAKIELLKLLGPLLKRPHADTLNGSRYANMKELRAKTAGAVMRIAFAFGPAQKAILLVGGDKSGVSEMRFYKQLIDKADKAYKAHLGKIKAQKKKGNG
jgi:hypothetical protein